MTLSYHGEQGPRKPNRTLWPISPLSSSSPLSSPTSSQSASSESPTSPPSSPPSPISSYFDPFEPPRSPMLWTWTCHICNRNWRVGTTTRCLDCGHRMCMPEEPKPQGNRPPSRRKKTNLNDISQLQPLSSLLSVDKPHIRRPMHPLKRGADLDRHRYNQQLKRHFRRSRIRQDRKRKIKHCRSQFDYNGWEDWNEWRRDVKQFNNALRNRYEDGSEDGDSTADSESTLDHDSNHEEDNGDATLKLVPATGRLHVVASSSPPPPNSPNKTPEWDCWNDCDFPSHCIHARNERKRREASLNRVFL